MLTNLKIDKILLYVIVFVLFFGNLTDVYFSVLLRPLDLAALLLFIRSIFLLRDKRADFFILFFFLVNLLFLYLNNKHFVGISSFFYLVRLVVYFYTYPFFLQYINTTFSKNLIQLVMPMFLIFHVAIFLFNSKLSVLNYDPHVGRLYGPFLDPNFYSVFLVVILIFYLNFFKFTKVNIFTICLVLISIFLTFSRLGILLTFFIFIQQYFVSKNSKYLSLFVGFLFLVLASDKYLLRLLLVGGNSQSLVFRLQSYLDAIKIYTINSLPLGYNNILLSKTFLTSNINMSSSFSDSLVLNLLVTGGLFNLFFLVFCFYLIGKKLVDNKMFSQSSILGVVLMASLIMNIIFHPYFLLIISIFISYYLKLNDNLKACKK